MSRTSFRCLLCESSACTDWLLDCPDVYLDSSLRADYVACEECGLIQQHPLPEDVAALYAGYPVHAARSGLQRLARNLFQHQVYYQPDRADAGHALLDYGCGDGCFLDDMTDCFASRVGFEPDFEHARSLSSRLSVPVYSSVDELRDSCAESMDCVTAHYVLEHLPQLHEAFETFRTVLKPGGVLYVAVPNARSWEARLFTRNWHGLDAPRHLVFPEAEHFVQLARTHGFGEPQLRYATFPNTVAGSMSALLTGRCRSAMLMAFILPAWLLALAAPQGTLVARFQKER